MTAYERYSTYENLVYYALHKYYPDFIKNEDIVQEGRIGLWRACLSCDESNGASFTTLAVPYIRNALRHGYEKLYGRSLGKRQLLWGAKSIYAPAKDDGDLQLQDIIPGDKDVQFLDISGALNSLPPRDREILLLWIAGYDQKEIADRHKVCVRTVSRVLKNAKEVFRDYI